MYVRRFFICQYGRSLCSIARAVYPFDLSPKASSRVPQFPQMMCVCNYFSLCPFIKHIYICTLPRAKPYLTDESHNAYVCTWTLSSTSVCTQRQRFALSCPLAIIRTGRHGSAMWFMWQFFIIVSCDFLGAPLNYLFKINKPCRKVTVCLC